MFLYVSVLLCGPVSLSVFWTVCQSNWRAIYDVLVILVDIRQHRLLSPRLVRDIFQQGGWSAMGRSCELHRWWLRHKVNGKPHLTTWHGISGIAATAGCRSLSTAGWLLHILRMYICISLSLSTYLIIYLLFIYSIYIYIYMCVCVCGPSEKM